MSDAPKASAADFPSTRWSRFAAPDGSTAARRQDLEHLAQTYWRPVCAYLRARWRLDPHTALDRTQEFFVWMLEGDFMRRADRTRGRFRALVKTALHNWLTDQARAQSAGKRGGTSTTLSLGPTDDDFARLEIEDLAQRTPDEVLDLRWRRELLAAALQQVESEFAAEGRAAWFELFREYFVDPEPGLDYATLAERHSISVHDVSNRLRKAKQRYRTALRRLVLETVTNEAELERELRWLFGDA